MSVIVREAIEQDVDGIRDVFLAVYGADYPFTGFYEDRWLKRSVFGDDILMLVALEVDDATSEEVRLLGTASVVFSVGAHSDLIGEFGRLAVHPDAQGMGVGRRLMQGRVEFIQHRLHVGIVENRCVHPFSQRISHAHDFVPVGFLPMKHQFTTRESVALFVRHFGAALTLRRNHPRIIPEVAPLAHLALERCGLSDDTIIDERSQSYPHGQGFAVDDLSSDGFASLLRIERGRLGSREVFGPMKLSYGFFKLTSGRATYLVARQGLGEAQGPVAGAIGFIHDAVERSIRVFELLSPREESIRQLLDCMLERARELDVAFVELDVSAHAPRMQRTVLELGFRPAAYVPAGVFHDVERLDIVKMVNLLEPLDLGDLALTEPSRVVAELVIQAFTRRDILPRVAELVHRIELFDGLDPDQITRVAGACTMARFDARDPVFSDGEEPTAMYLILSGSVEVRVGGRAIARVGEGETLGEISMVSGGLHGATAVACSEVEAAELSHADLAELNRLRPDIGLVIYRNLAAGLGRKLRAADHLLADGDTDP